MAAISYYRNDETGELSPPHCIGTDEDGRAICLFVEGWSPVDRDGNDLTDKLAADEDGNWIVELSRNPSRGRTCIHDLQLRATTAFKAVLASTTLLHGELLTLEGADWEEEMPSDRMWHFVHHDYPGVMIDWTPGQQPVAHETSMTAWRYKRRLGGE